MTLPSQSEVQTLLIPDSGWIRRLVDVYAPWVEAPQEALAGMAYTLLSAAVGWRSHLQWADSREPLTLFTVLVGRSASAHKTTVLKIGTRLAQDANMLYREIVGAGDEDDDFIKVVSGGHTSQAGLLREISPEDEDGAERWRVDPPPGTLLEWDELKDLVVDKGAGYSFLQDTRQMLLRLYGGFSPGSTTLSTPFPASRVAVSMLGTITEEDWEQKLSPDAVTGGMMGRLFAVPTGKAPKHHPRPSEVRAEERGALVDWLAQLGALPYQNGFGRFQFTDEAGNFWDEWYIDHKTRVEEMEREDPVLAQARGALFNRYQAIAQKFAGLQAISQWDGDRAHPPKPVADLPTIHSACAYADLALDQTSQVAAEILEAPDERFSRRVMNALSQGPLGLSELQRRVRIRGVDAIKWHKYLDICEYNGLVQKLEETRNTPTGTRRRIVVSLAD